MQGQELPAQQHNTRWVQHRCQCSSVICMLLPHKSISCRTMQAGELLQQLAGMQLQDSALSAGGPDNQQPGCQLFRHAT